MEASRPSVVVLHLEPDRAEATMLASVLRDVWPQTFTLLRAGSLREAEARLAQGDVDCILAEAAGIAAALLERLRLLAPAVPVVVLTDQADEERALRAVRAGAQDVLAKGADGGAVGRALLYAVERKRAEQGLLDVARLHEAAMLALGEGVLVLDGSGRVTAATPPRPASCGSRPSDSTASTCAGRERRSWTPTARRWPRRTGRHCGRWPRASPRRAGCSGCATATAGRCGPR